MSRNDTLAFFFALAMAIVALPASAQANSFHDCINSGLKERGVDPRMQNRWNANTIAGRIHVFVVKLCTEQLKLSETQSPSDDRIVPVNYETEETSGAAGVREI